MMCTGGQKASLRCWSSGDAADPFFHSREDYPDDIFPPYPRGALRVLSLDVVRLLALRRSPPVVRGDDPSLGVHLRQLVMEQGAFLQLDDRGAMTRFAMEPTCHAEGAYCPLKNTTWIVHHVSPRAIRCMFEEDVAAGHYQRADGSWRARDSAVFPALCACVDRRQRPLGLRGLRSRARHCPRRSGWAVA